jgi:hypothetical protein
MGTGDGAPRFADPAGCGVIASRIPIPTSAEPTRITSQTRLPRELGGAQLANFRPTAPNAPSMPPAPAAQIKKTSLFIGLTLSIERLVKPALKQKVPKAAFVSTRRGIAHNFDDR